MLEVAEVHIGSLFNMWKAPVIFTSIRIPTLSFLQAGCPSCHPTISVKALKGMSHNTCISRYTGCGKKKDATTEISFSIISAPGMLVYFPFLTSTT